MVTLTTGKMPVFMLAEPVILVAAVVGFIICLRNNVRRS
jgi:type III secretory pathway component EscS